MGIINTINEQSREEYESRHNWKGTNNYEVTISGNLPGMVLSKEHPPLDYFFFHGTLYNNISNVVKIDFSPSSWVFSENMKKYNFHITLEFKTGKVYRRDMFVDGKTIGMELNSENRIFGGWYLDFVSDYSKDFKLVITIKDKTVPYPVYGLPETM